MHFTAEGFNPNLTTFNSIFRVAGIIRQDGEFLIQLIDVWISRLCCVQEGMILIISLCFQETLKSMVRLGVKPDVRTLNAILESITRIPIYRMAREIALQVLADFKSIGVSPSLGSYYYFLRIFCRESNQFTAVGLFNFLIISFIFLRGTSK